MVVYSCKNKINGKIYVGKTKNKLKTRISEHKSAFKHDKYKSKIYSAFKKYGFDNFEWHVLEECKNEDELNEREKYWIAKLNSISEGYNINKGGNGGDNWTYNPRKSQIRDKISKAVKMSGRWSDERKKEYSKKISGLNNVYYKSENARKSFTENNPMLNETYKKKLIEKMRSDNPMWRDEIIIKHKIAVNNPDRLKRISEALKGRKMPPMSHSQKIKISEAHKGKKLSDEHKLKLSISGRGRVVSKKTREKMSKALKGRVFSKEHKASLSKSFSKQWWVQLNKDGSVLNIFSNGRDILREKGFNPSNIKDCDSTPNRSFYGYKWKKYKKNEITKEEIYQIHRKST